MSKNYNRAKASKYNTGREIKMKVIIDQDPYIHECWSDMYPARRRMCRTWKHTRNSQYK